MPKMTFSTAFGGERKYIAEEELLSLKSYFSVSMPGIMKRAEMLGLISAESSRYFCISYNKKGYRDEEPGEYMGDESSILCRQLYHKALAERRIPEQNRKAFSAWL